jgi:hypothetical protein
MPFPRLVPNYPWISGALASLIALGATALSVREGYKKKPPPETRHTLEVEDLV